ncbi:hypothetical protein L1987_12390 [Smallanthus sonchifolius]|uniref:Uncharacterized protein n=1 Tax=Smallanthus sonchifolius TaxID=185202 RepID=A0ACB9JF65_9ASTR|nr:hypothetical protein L1987_12390 [Smallanthus sonchifolius]
MNVSASRKQSSLVWKSPSIAPQRSSLSVPIVHMGCTNVRVKVNDERIVYRTALWDLYQPKSEVFADGSLEIPLLKHQQITLLWMVQKETKNMHYFKGGILADHQELGKTISTIALILKEWSPFSSAGNTDPMVLSNSVISDTIKSRTNTTL